jgi:hypothetical protein
VTGGYFGEAFTTLAATLNFRWGIQFPLICPMSVRNI